MTKSLVLRFLAIAGMRQACREKMCVFVYIAAVIQFIVIYDTDEGERGITGALLGTPV